MPERRIGRGDGGAVLVDVDVERAPVAGEHAFVRRVAAAVDGHLEHAGRVARGHGDRLHLRRARWRRRWRPSSDAEPPRVGCRLAGVENVGDATDCEVGRGGRAYAATIGRRLAGELEQVEAEVNQSRRADDASPGAAVSSRLNVTAPRGRRGLRRSVMDQAEAEDRSTSHSRSGAAERRRGRTLSDSCVLRHVEPTARVAPAPRCVDRCTTYDVARRAVGRLDLDVSTTPSIACGKPMYRARGLRQSRRPPRRLARRVTAATGPTSPAVDTQRSPWIHRSRSLPTTRYAPVSDSNTIQSNRNQPVQRCRRIAVRRLRRRGGAREPAATSTAPAATSVRSTRSRSGGARRAKLGDSSPSYQVRPNRCISRACC